MTNGSGESDTLPSTGRRIVLLTGATGYIGGRLLKVLKSRKWRLRYAQRLAKLRQWINARGLRPRGDPLRARYDPPFKPWFLRRNEILIRIEEPTGMREKEERK